LVGWWLGDHCYTLQRWLASESGGKSATAADFLAKLKAFDKQRRRRNRSSSDDDPTTEESERESDNPADYVYYNGPSTAYSDTSDSSTGDDEDDKDVSDGGGRDENSLALFIH